MQKLKKAIKSPHPIEAVNEIISEYDELHRLAVWRLTTIKSGKNLKKHQKELDRIADLLEKSGYYVSFCEEDLDKEIRKYFKQ